MTDFAMTMWGVGIALWVVVGFYMYQLSRSAWKDRLMRCPETGAITLVGVEHVSPRTGNEPRLAVERCGLWPEKAGCARGCLVRYGETAAGFRVNPRALRPFEPR